MTLIFGILTILIGLASYTWYISGIFKRGIRPHAVSWFVWALLSAFISYEQYISGAGPGVWVTVLSALAGITICILALIKGDHHITRFDLVCLVAALSIFVTWFVVNDPLALVIAASVVFVIGFIPTIRKAFHNVEHETAVTFGLNSVKFALALFALQTVTLTTVMYPATLMVMNAVFVIFLLVRMRKLRILKP